MGLRETFTILGSARSEQVMPALMAALDQKNDKIVAGAASAILEQRSPEGFLELLKRYEQFPPAVREAISRSLYRLRDSMPQFVKGASLPIRRTLLDVLRANTSIDTLPVLALYLEDEEEPQLRIDAGEAIGAVVTRFAAERDIAERGVDASGRPVNTSRSMERIKLDIEVARRALSEAIEKLEAHRSPAVVRACCEIGREGHEVLFDAIKRGGHAGITRELILQMLRGDDSLPAAEFIFSLAGEQDEILRKIGVELLRARATPDAVDSVLRAIVKLPQDRQRHLIKVNHGVPWLPVIAPQINRLPRKYARFLYTEIDKLQMDDESRAPLLAALAHSADPQIQNACIEKLAGNPTSAARRSISKLMESGDETTQLKVVNALIAAAPEDLTHVLAPYMSGRFESVRKASGQAIARAGFSQYSHSFDQLDDATRELAGRAFTQLDENHLNELLGDLDHMDSKKRVKAIRIIQATGSHRKIGRDMIDLVNDPDRMVRATIIRLLVAMRNTEAIKALMKLLSDNDSRVQANAVEAIEELNEPKLRQVLVPFLRHPNNRVRGNACKALWKMGVVEVVSVIFAMLDDPNPKMRMTAAWVIREIRPAGGLARVEQAIKREEDRDVLERLKKTQSVLRGAA
ncbi:MAG: HEAT repeat domain-containing protein [Planctomycetes bacterium]|nr:HEAT repeat domain-containing protein [Planctomycetota bacterium]NUQ35948.1 HEAT repeat domain-containing protein [Planctomycetaceae bacterium]